MGLGVEPLQARIEQGRVDAADAEFGLHLVEQLEVAARVDEFRLGEPRVAAERAPRALDKLRGGEACALRGCFR